MHLFIELLFLCLTLSYINSTMPNTIQLDMAAVQEEPWYHQSQIPQVTILAGWPQVGAAHLAHIEFNLCMIRNKQLLRAMGLWEATVMILWGVLSSSLSGSNLKGVLFCSSFLNFGTPGISRSLMERNKRFKFMDINELPLRPQWHDIPTSFLDPLRLLQKIS